MNSPAESLQFSEDYSILDEDGAQRTKFELAQYHVKDFNFWSREKVSRSINRLLSSDVDASSSISKVPYPLESGTSVKYLSTDWSSEAINFPNVFQARLIGEKSVNTLQEWECVIEFIDDDIVTARGTSLLDDDPESNILEIPMREFAQKDWDELSSGVIFRLIIGFTKKPSGQRIRESICYLRRSLPPLGYDLEGITNL